MDGAADFSGLRKSIQGVQAASKALDEEKDEAERKFRELLDKLPHRRRHAVHAHPHAHPDRSEHGHGHEHGEDRPRHVHLRGHCGQRRFSSLPEWLRRILERIFGHGKPPGPIRKFIEAAKRVQRANARLVAFERGFISEEGIKDREWYKHLGVAPGKWLGTCWMLSFRWTLSMFGLALPLAHGLHRAPEPKELARFRVK